jgi:hypothetical protein
MVARQPRAGPGLFQWNTGGWFGAQIGSTVWMLLVATWMAPLAPEIAVVGLLCFVVPNVLGTWTWCRRDWIAPHLAIQMLMASLTASSLLLLITLDWFWPAAIPREPLGRGYAVCLGVPVMMAGWYVRERVRAKRRQQPPDRPDNGL